ncbi:MAG: sulfite exporter TauE/SafE family protein [Thermodesulfobacteriota bacterium]
MDATIATCIAAALLAGFIQGFSGFGSVLVALPVLLTALDARTAVPLVSMVALSINIVMTARLRGHVRKGPMRLLLASSLPGMAAGAWILDGAPDSVIKGILGAVILFVVAQSAAAKGPGAPLAKGWTVLAGFTSGGIGLLTGANGPPVIAWAARQPWARDELRATLTFYFLLTGFLIVGTQAAKGLVTGEVGALFGWSVPALAAGLWAGFAACGKANERVFRAVVLTLLGFIGAGLLWQAARAFLGA